MLEKGSGFPSRLVNTGSARATELKQINKVNNTAGFKIALHKGSRARHLRIFKGRMEQGHVLQNKNLCVIIPTLSFCFNCLKQFSGYKEKKMIKHRPRKRFGQNFLQDPAIIAQMIQALHLKKSDLLVEIGPGRGALTAPLLSSLDSLTAIEIDRDLQVILKETLTGASRLNLLNGDALTFDYARFGSPLRIVGNLPYNISTPLLLHLLSYCSQIRDMHFMLQKEVVERLAAAPGTRDYGRLSVMVQYFCTVTPLFDVPPEAFYPSPKVCSAVVRLEPHDTPPFPDVSRSLLEKTVAKAFHMRRKTLANNFKDIFGAEDLIALGLDPKTRPEQLSVMDYVRLAIASPG